MACPENSTGDRFADLKALIRRLMEAARAPTITDQMRADLTEVANIVWEYMILVECEDPTQIAQIPSERPVRRPCTRRRIGKRSRPPA
jgi:hypothetical protein